eukprot:NODE_15_length_4092_cov_55.990106_g11_i0.p1 GENE.NODE_15_length_4092_cov_55.990106_g11_i0~~NODE_15_length_4092_cov_55.990106_g11_i0.p1  ORF type:complete len:1321 (+),score=114.08 NODE_15_length_4092_cov_55.990106_g11_i0:504-3965(+)
MNEISFLSRSVSVGAVDVPGMKFSPKFSLSRTNKSLKWFRPGELSEERLAFEKLNSLLLLLPGHGRAVFEEWRDRFFDAVEELGYVGRLRTWDDALAIWERPELAAAYLPGVECQMMALNSGLNVVSGTANVVAEGAQALSNVARTVGKTVEKVADTFGFDNPNIGTQPSRFVPSTPYLMNGATQVSEAQVMAMNASPNRLPSTAHFGISESQTTFESLCKPVFRDTITVSQDVDVAGTIIYEGWLTCAPVLTLATAGDTVQPLACGYVASRFQTWQADIDIILDFVFPKVATMRVAFAFFPMQTEIPQTIDGLQSSYVSFRDIKDGSTTHHFRVPYQGNTPRKDVPNGPPTLDNSFGRFAVYVFNELATPAPSTGPLFDVNILYGLSNVTFDNWGLNNHSLRAEVGELQDFMPSEVQMEALGTAAVQSAVPVPEDDTSPGDSPDIKAANPESSNKWNFDHLMNRNQIVANLDFMDGQEDGQTLATFELPNETLVGTHVTAAERFSQMSGENVITIQTQGQVFATGQLIACVMPGVGANAASRILDTKQSQTFVSHQLIRVTDASSVELRVPFCYWKDAHVMGESPYATVVIKVFNRYRTGEGGPTRVAFTVMSRWENVNFNYLNPDPDRTRAILQASRRALQRRLGAKRVIKPKTKMLRQQDSNWDFIQRNKNVKTHKRNGKLRSSGKKSTRKLTLSDYFMKSEVQMDSGGIMDAPGMHSVSGAMKEEEVATLAKSSESRPLDPDVTCVEQLMRRFSPVFHAPRNNFPAAVTVGIAEMFDARKINAGALRSPFDWFGAMFMGFNGQVRIAFNCDTRRIYCAFTASPRMNAADFRELVGVGEGVTPVAQTIHSGFSPFMYSVGDQTNQIMSNWISQQRYARLPKFNQSLEEKLGSFQLLVSEQTPSTGLTVLAAFADNARFGLPVFIPRVSIRSTTALGDLYPSSFGNFTIGQFLEVKHLNGGLTFAFSASDTQQALSAVPEGAVVPPEPTPPSCVSFIIQTNLFTPQNLRDMGFSVPADATITYQDDVVTQVELDISTLLCVPTVANLTFIDDDPVTMAPFVDQKVQLKGNLPSIDNGTVYDVGITCTMFPPYADEALLLWGISDPTATPPVPYAAVQEFTRSPTVKFTSGGKDYGVITTAPLPEAVLLNTI